MSEANSFANSSSDTAQGAWVDDIKLTTYDGWAIKLPVYKSKLVMLDGFCYMHEKDMPNRWIRFWYRVLLGWRWERVEQ